MSSNIHKVRPMQSYSEILDSNENYIGPIPREAQQILWYPAQTMFSDRAHSNICDSGKCLMHSDASRFKKYRTVRFL